MASVWYLVVAGGGGGGKDAGTGGGAGGYRTNAAYDFAVTVQAYTVTIGAGGPGGTSTNAAATAGNDSVFSTITSLGGGYGTGVFNGAGGAGGSGGGGRFQSGAGADGTVGQGNNGGNGAAAANYGGGGGGGASAVGANGSTTNGGSGGNGTASTISGASVTYAGGGGGGVYVTGTPGTGGTGGGGNGVSAAGAVGGSGTANTGGGGGGSGTNVAGNGGPGGSGVVIVRYATADLTATGGTITTDGAYTVHTFTSSGTFEVTDITVAPVADFSGTPLTGTAPLSVQFTDLSTNTPTSWAWTFGDAQTSTAQNPSNTYAAAGTYTVGLTATNAAGSDIDTKTNYITVSAVASDVKTGTGGIDPSHSQKRVPFKPTGLLTTKPKAKDARVQERIDDSAVIEAEIAGKLAKEFGEESAQIAKTETEATEAKAIVQMSMAEVDREIGILLQKKLRTEEEELTLIMLMAASAA